MPALPERPLALAPRFVARRVMAIAVPVLGLGALGASALSLTADDLARLEQQERVHESGVRAEHPRVDIERDVSVFVFRARRYDVAFDDADGVTHRARLREHDVSVAPLVVEGPPEVHYDPADPSRISVGFARQNLGAQRSAIALLGAVGVTFLVLACWALALLSRGLRRARRVARTPRVGAARVHALERSYDSRGAATGELQLALAPEALSLETRETYRAREGTAAETASEARDAAPLHEITPADDPPLFLDRAFTRALVATDGAGTTVLVRRSGHPFSLGSAELASLREGTYELDARALGVSGSTAPTS